MTHPPMMASSRKTVSHRARVGLSHGRQAQEQQGLACRGAKSAFQIEYRWPNVVQSNWLDLMAGLGDLILQVSTALLEGLWVPIAVHY